MLQLKSIQQSLVQWVTLVISPLRKMRLEVLEFKDSLSHIGRSCLKNQKKKERKKERKEGSKEGRKESKRERERQKQGGKERQEGRKGGREGGKTKQDKKSEEEKRKERKTYHNHMQMMDHGIMEQEESCSCHNLITNSTGCWSLLVRWHIPGYPMGSLQVSSAD
jgi:hypothetical protein